MSGPRKRIVIHKAGHGVNGLNFSFQSHIFPFLLSMVYATENQVGSSGHKRKAVSTNESEPKSKRSKKKHLKENLQAAKSQVNIVHHCLLQNEYQNNCSNIIPLVFFYFS